MAPEPAESGAANDVLGQLRGQLPERRPNARSTAALLDNPACVRRSVMDAANIDLNKAADLLGAPPKFGQSPFALGQGNRFERRVKDGGYALLVEVLREVGFDLPDQLKTVAITGAPTQAGLDSRVAQTIEALRSIGEDRPDAPNVIDHGVTTLDIGGKKVYLEQDALAFRVGDRIQICEVKGFPIVDGSAEPEKVGAAARQTAVYLASLQDTLAEIGADPDLVSDDVVLICTKNYGLQPTARTVNVNRELRALRRQLARKDRIRDILAAHGGAELLDQLSDLADNDVGGRVAAIVQGLPCNFVPRCISDCDMARHCRSEAEASRTPGRLGDEVQNLVAGVGDIGVAAEISNGVSPPSNGFEVAQILKRARRAVTRADDLGVRT